MLGRIVLPNLFRQVSALAHFPPLGNPCIPVFRRTLFLRTCRIPSELYPWVLLPILSLNFTVPRP